jgi:thiol:disulfide interchange protein DsbC
MRHLLSLAMACASCLPSAHAEPVRTSPAAVTKAIAARLPHTAIRHVDCGVLPGLCEVQAGSTLFYTDPKARFLVVGHVYDLETHQDLTATRLLAINPDSMVPTTTRPVSEDKPAVAATTAAPVQNVTLADLPASGAIEWGGKGPHITIFSDFHCSYCRLLHQALKDMGARVTERPISVLGTRAISEAVLCAGDHGVAVDAAYAGEAPARRACDVSGLDANEAFARTHGFSGTPVLVRDDGAVVLGYRPREFLEAWLKGSN